MKWNREVWSLTMWAIIGWSLTEVIIWTGWASELSVRAFAGGAFLCFLGLTVIGGWRQSQMQRNQERAREQFEKDVKAEQEQQAQIDQTIIDKLRNEHELSGTEQDRRLKALETALKHLRKK